MYDLLMRALVTFIARMIADEMSEALRGRRRR